MTHVHAGCSSTVLRLGFKNARTVRCRRGNEKDLSETLWSINTTVRVAIKGFSFPPKHLLSTFPRKNQPPGYSKDSRISIVSIVDFISPLCVTKPKCESRSRYSQLPIRAELHSLPVLSNFSNEREITAKVSHSDNTDPFRRKLTPFRGCISRALENFPPLYFSRGRELAQRLG